MVNLSWLERAFTLEELRANGICLPVAQGPIVFQKFKSTLDPVGGSFPKKITCGRSRSCQRDGLPSTSLLSLLTHAEDLAR